MFKKIGLITTLGLLLFSGSAMGQTKVESPNEVKTLFKAEEVTDLKILEEKAYEGEHINIDKGKFAKSVLNKKQVAHLQSINEDNEFRTFSIEDSQKEEADQVVQLLEVTEDENGDREEIYSVTYLIDIEEKEDGSFTILSNSSSKSKADATGSVRATSTVNFSIRNDSSGVQHAKVTTASGTWTVLQTGVSLSNRNVSYGTRGVSSFGSTSGQTATRTFSTNSWNISAPSTWIHAETGSGFSNIGATSNVNLSGRTTSRLQLINIWQ